MVSERVKRALDNLRAARKERQDAFDEQESLRREVERVQTELDRLQRLAILNAERVGRAKTAFWLREDMLLAAKQEARDRGEDVPPSKTRQAGSGGA
jgi:predicted  nucleic acid-binding Zn-ribbon protein